MPPTRFFAWDTETAMISPGVLAPPLVCVSYIWEGDADYSLLLDRDGLDVVEAALRDPDVHIVGHNVAYDFAVMLAERPHLAPLVFQAYETARVSDTRVREKLIRLARGEMTTDFAQASGAGRQAKFDLATIFMRRFQIDLSADKNDPLAWRTRYAELMGIPVAEWPEDAKKYAGEDAIRHLVLFQEQRKDAVETFGRTDGFVTNEHETAAAAFALHMSAVWGVRTDAAAVHALDARLLEEVRETREVLVDNLVLRAKDGTKDMKHLASLVTAAYNGAPPTTPGRLNKKTGVRTPAVATDKETLINAPTANQIRVSLMKDDPDNTGTKIRTDVPILQAVADISAPEHNKATYIPAMLFGTGCPINPGINELVESGRTSYFKPNLQNLPRLGGYRECFIPRRGWMFINTDYSTVELCALAQVNLTLFGYSKMAEALNEGKDLHLDMAAEILQLPYEEVLRRKKEPIIKKHRQMSKALNFGFPGGLGAETAIAYAWTTWGVKFDDDPDEAIKVVKGHKRTWLRKWPEMQEFFGMVASMVSQGGGSMQVQQMGSGRLRGGTGYCDGCNTFFQGLAADGAKASMFFIQQESYTGFSRFWTEADHGATKSPLFGSRQAIFVHDEFIGESVAETAHLAAERLAVVARSGMELYIDKVPIVAEPVLMRRWYKDAETVRDPTTKQLIPWEPPCT